MAQHLLGRSHADFIQQLAICQSMSASSVSSASASAGARRQPQPSAVRIHTPAQRNLPLHTSRSISTREMPKSHRHAIRPWRTRSCGHRQRLPCMSRAPFQAAETMNRIACMASIALHLTPGTPATGCRQVCRNSTAMQSASLRAPQAPLLVGCRHSTLRYWLPRLTPDHVRL